MAAFAALLVTTPTGIGGSDQPIEAISVEIVMLPAVSAASAVTAAPAAATAARARDAAPEVKPERAPPPERPVALDTVETENGGPKVAAPQPRPEPPERAAVTTPAPETPTLSSEPRQVERPPDAPIAPAPAKPLPQPSEALPSPGGASSPADPVVARPAPTPSVSPGRLRRFAQDVARSLARTPPKTLRATGTVTISFTVAADGELETAVIKRSSGREAIDEAALAAVRRAHFPKPPPGATAHQRTFEIPYRFRSR